MRGRRLGVGVVGKVRWRDEYVRANVADEPFASFEAWLAENVEWAAERAGTQWNQAYRRGRLYAFVHQSAADDRAPLVAGAMVPSCDGAGRNFPLVVLGGIDAGPICEQPHMLPFLLEGFWGEASEAVISIMAQPVDLVQHLSRVSLDAVRLPDDAIASYTEWASALTLAELWSLIYGESAQGAGRAARSVLDAVRPYRGTERPKTPLTLRLPLGMAAGAAVCFWIDLVRRTAWWQKTVPTFFWSHDGTTGDMLLHLGTPPRSTLAELWLPTGRRDEFCDLTRPPDTEPAGAAEQSVGSLAAGLLAGAPGTVLDLLRASEA